MDYLHYKKIAARGELDPHYMNKDKAAFSKYKNELDKMTSMQFTKKGEEGVFVEMPGYRFTTLNCTSDFTWNFASSNRNESLPWTFGVDGVVCTVLDEASGKWLAFDARGKIIEQYRFSPPSVPMVGFQAYMSSSFLADKTIRYIRIGRSVTARALYVTTGGSIIYRLNLDGVPDYPIEIQTDQPINQ
jgi:hypothetical protein